MEQLNKIELRGMVGNVTIQNYPQGKVAHFTVATSLAYHDKSGNPVIDTQWHNITAWESRTIQNLESIQKGCKIYVLGRLKTQRFTGSDGVDRNSVEVQASRVTVIDTDEILSSEM